MQKKKRWNAIMTRMTLELYSRRKRMLELYYAGALNEKTFQRLASDLNTKKETLRRDWGRRKEWEALIWMADQSEEDVKKLLYVLQIARERAISLMRTADQDSVKVSAIGKLTEIVRREIELRQSLGLLNKEPLTLNVNGLETAVSKIIEFSRQEETENEG